MEDQTELPEKSENKFQKDQKVVFTNPETNQTEYGTIIRKSLDHNGCWYVKSDKNMVWWIKEYLLKVIN